jgi:HK97 family phage major capsid protein
MVAPAHPKGPKVVSTDTQTMPWVAAPELELSPYGPDSPHSYFRGLARVAAADRQAQAMNEHHATRVDGGGISDLAEQWIPSPDASLDGTLTDARKRIERARAGSVISRTARSKATHIVKRERDRNGHLIDVENRWVEGRDLTSTTGAGGDFVPRSGTPNFIADEFATAARAQSMLRRAFTVRPLPPAGKDVEVARLTAQASVATTTDASAISNTGPTTALATSNIAYIAGQVTVGRQLLDRSNIDQAIAAELGKAVGAAADTEWIQGTGGTGRVRGLDQVSGIVAVTYTDAAPTSANTISQIWNAYSQLATATTGYGTADPDRYAVIMHPRRYAFIQANKAGQGALQAMPGTVVPTAGVPIVSSQDAIYVVDRTQSFLLADPPTFTPMEQTTAAGNLEVMFVAYQPISAMFAKSPNASAKIIGSGTTTPTW